MQASRFVVSQAAVALIGNAYAANKVITLGPATATETLGCPLPVKGAHLYNLEITLSTAAGGATQVTPRLCHDLAGDHPIWSGTATGYAAGITDATVLTVVFSVDREWVPTSDQTADGRIYLFLLTNVGTITCEKAVMNYLLLGG